MRKIIVLTFLTLDGVMQAPGGPDEDPSGGFKYGGWTAPFSDDFLGNVINEQMKNPFDLLLGLKTYEIFAAYWPYVDGKENLIAEKFNRTKKYVVSETPEKLDWENSHLITGDVPEEIKKLKQEDGPDLHVYGSGNFVQTLLRHDLVDELWLKIYPLTLGPGKRLFAEGTQPVSYKLIDSQTSPSGVIIANYARVGEVKTGSLVESSTPSKAELARREKWKEEK